MTSRKPRSIEIPSTWFGLDNKESYRRIMEEDSAKGNSGRAEGSREPFDFSNNGIVGSDYVQIPGTGKVISKFESPGLNNLDWEGTHFKLNEKGLYMPNPSLFMPHFVNVVDCYRNKKPLFDAQGNPVSEKELEDIYRHLTMNHIAAYASEGGNRAGAWTWLDAKFEQKKESMFIHTDHRIVNQTVTPQPTKTEKLEACLTESAWADLKFNKQGLAIERSSSNEYVQGENIYFWAPRNGAVAGFYADSGGALLSCDWIPSLGDSSLGVFAVAQQPDGEVRSGKGTGGIK